MKKYIFAVFDSAAQAYLDPFVAPTLEFAIREFRAITNKEGTTFNRFPQDYVLFHIGEWDFQSGEITAMSPRSLGVAITFMETENA